MEKLRNNIQRLLAERELAKLQLTDQRLSLDDSLNDEEYERRWLIRLELHNIIASTMHAENNLRRELGALKACLTLKQYRNGN